jgi:hypothetical protein
MIFIIILAVIAIVCIESLIVMGLWNWVIVGLFGVNPISFLMAIGVVFVLDVIGSFFRKTIKVEK